MREFNRVNQKDKKDNNLEVCSIGIVNVGKKNREIKITIRIINNILQLPDFFSYKNKFKLNVVY